MIINDDRSSKLNPHWGINANWMGKLSNQLTLQDIIIPGSHDAGLYAHTDNTKGLPKNQTRTQHLNVHEQLIAGSRFFDLRVYLDPIQRTLHIGHFAERKFPSLAKNRGQADIGSFGPSLVEILTQVREFMDDDLSKTQGKNQETVILRFSHTDETIAAEIIKKIKMILDPYLFKSPYEDVNLCLIPLGYLKGKVLIICEEPTHGTRNFEGQFSAHNGIFRFAPYNPEQKQSGMPIAGNFSNTPFAGKTVAKQEKKMTTMVPALKQTRNHLIQVYWTVTWGNIEVMTGFLEHRTMLNFLKKYRNNLPNIMLLDFVGDFKTTPIIQCNFSANKQNTPEIGADYTTPLPHTSRIAWTESSFPTYAFQPVTPTVLPTWEEPDFMEGF